MKLWQATHLASEMGDQSEFCNKTFTITIEQHVLDTNNRKQLSQAATDV
jgi:hypothetical protein